MLHDGSTQDEPFDHRFSALAGHLGCSEECAANAFYGLEFPEYIKPSHMELVRKRIKQLNLASSKADSLVAVLRNLPTDAWQDLQQRGAITLQQLEFFADALRDDHAFLNKWYSGQDRRGGKIIAAYVVAEGVRRAFRRSRTPIKFGENDGYPSTLFGRAVEDTIAAFGIRSGWKGPARDAWQKQERINARLGQIHGYLVQRDNIAKKYPEFNWQQIAFQTRGRNVPDRMVRLSLRGSSVYPHLDLMSGEFFNKKNSSIVSIKRWLAGRQTEINANSDKEK